MKAPDIIEYLTEREFLGLSASPAQRAFLKAFYALPPTEAEFEIYRMATNREKYPEKEFAEGTVGAGARSGKDSRIACPIASYEAVFGGHEKKLAPGERAVVPIVAPGQMGTRIAFDYIRSHFEESKALGTMVEDIKANEIRLVNRLSIIGFPCTKSVLRGWSIPAGILDEVAFFRLEGSAESDAEIQASIRRGMISFQRTKLIKISTPYMKSGILYDDFKNHFAKDSPDLLCWRAPSTFMNPALKAGRLEREQRLDPQRFNREYLAEFAEDLESFLPLAWVEQATVKGRFELPQLPGVSYIAAVDPSGGGADAFTLSICHCESYEAGPGRVVQDVMRGFTRAKRDEQLDLEGIAGQISRIVRGYGVNVVHGDRYAGQWVRQAFERAGVAYRETEKPKSDFYLEVEPLFSTGRIEILDNATLLRELRLLEKKTRAGGKVLVDHPSAQHDDHANALAIAAALSLNGAGVGEFWVGGDRMTGREADLFEDGSPFPFRGRGAMWDDF